MIAVLMPTTRPAPLTSGPPELPGLRGDGLDHAFDQPSRASPQAAAERADDARRHRTLEPEWVADRRDELADAQLRRTPEDGMKMPGAAQAQHGQIGVRIVADQLGADDPAVGQRGLEHGGTGYDMAVGERVPVGRKHDARALPDRPAVRPLPANMDDRRSGALVGADDLRGIGIE
jgi:hypothetical protein